MKRYSGRFVLRVPPEVHQRLSSSARTLGISLNQYCSRLLAESPGSKVGRSEEEDSVTSVLKDKLSTELEGVVRFGSKARREATESSDTDLLIIVGAEARIDRARYREWDGWRFPRNLSPHFVRLPESPSEAHGLWLEVAVEGEILFDREGNVAAFLRTLRHEMARGAFRRRWSHGHPYWERVTA